MGHKKVLKNHLTLKQQLFVQNYLIDFNATQAAVRAGYSEKTARKIGSENLTKPDIAVALQAAAVERMERVKVDADWVLQKLVKVCERCMEPIPVLDSQGNPTGVFKFDSAGACRALENIGKHTNVNAFKALDEKQRPIDQNWRVTIVDAKETLEQYQELVERGLLP